MMKIIRYLIAVVAFISVIPGTHAADKLNVFVSILPQQYFIERIGGQYVDVSVMVGPGQSPVTYEPTPGQMVKLGDADIYFAIGVPFESAWLDKVEENNKQLLVIKCCESIADLKNHHTHDNHEQTLWDPHIWTSPEKVARIVELVRQSLSSIDRVNSVAYQIASTNFINELNALDRKIKSSMQKLAGKKFIVSHPSWGYFARRYGLKQISIEQNGKEIQAGAMVDLIRLARENNIKTVFVQPQFNDRAATVLAKEIGATVMELDPLAADYIENINKVADRIAKGLSR